MANNQVIPKVIAEGTKEQRGLSGSKTAGFKPSPPAGYVRPNPVPVPATTK